MGTGATRPDYASRNSFRRSLSPDPAVRGSRTLKSRKRPAWSPIAAVSAPPPNPPPACPPQVRQTMHSPTELRRVRWPRRQRYPRAWGRAFHGGLGHIHLRFDREGSHNRGHVLGVIHICCRRQHLYYRLNGPRHWRQRTWRRGLVFRGLLSCVHSFPVAATCCLRDKAHSPGSSPSSSSFFLLLSASSYVAGGGPDTPVATSLFLDFTIAGLELGSSF